MASSLVSVAAAAQPFLPEQATRKLLMLVGDEFKPKLAIC